MEIAENYDLYSSVFITAMEIVKENIMKQPARTKKIE